MPALVRIVTADDPAQRNRSLESACDRLSLEELLRECAELDAFRRRSENLYERVRALFFLYAIHRFHLPQRLRNGTAPSSRDPGPAHQGSRSLIPFKGYEHLLRRKELLDGLFEAAPQQMFVAIERNQRAL